MPLAPTRRVSISLHGEGAQTNFPLVDYSKEVKQLQVKLAGLTREELQRALGVKPMDKSSQHRGVSKKKGKWEAKVMLNRKWAYRGEGQKGPCTCAAAWAHCWYMACGLVAPVAKLMQVLPWHAADCQQELACCHAAAAVASSHLAGSGLSAASSVAQQPPDLADA